MAYRAPAHLDGRSCLRLALFSGNYNYTVDGANRALNRLVDHLERRTGAQVRVYSPTGPRPAFAPAGELVSVPSVRVPLRPDYRLALGLPRAIEADVRAFQPDLIHLSAPDLLGGQALRLARRMDVPVVASIHTHFETYLDYYGLGWLEGLVRQRLDAFYARCDTILAPTPAIARQMDALGTGARVRIWSRGVDPDLFRPDARSDHWRAGHGLSGARPTIVFLGRLVMEKGLAVFAETVKRLRARFGPLPVLVIGDGPARGWFEANLPDATFAGFLSGQDLAVALASGDILFNPSHTETFGNVNLEAMASGLAVVGADAPNTRDLLQDGNAGLLCEPDNAAAFAEALGRLVEDSALLARLSAAALERSRAFRWPAILDDVAAAYAETIAAHRAQGQGAAGFAAPRGREAA